MPRAQLYEWLGVDHQSIRARDVAVFGRIATAKMRTIVALIHLTEHMTGHAAAAQGFDAAKWVCGWLNWPNPALGGVKPHELLDTRANQATLRRLLVQSATGVFVQPGKPSGIRNREHAPLKVLDHPSCTVHFASHRRSQVASSSIIEFTVQEGAVV